MAHYLGLSETTTQSTAILLLGKPLLFSCFFQGSLFVYLFYFLLKFDCEFLLELVVVFEWDELVAVPKYLGFDLRFASHGCFSQVLIVLVVVALASDFDLIQNVVEARILKHTDCVADAVLDTL